MKILILFYRDYYITNFTKKHLDKSVVSNKQLKTNVNRDVEILFKLFFR